MKSTKTATNLAIQKHAHELFVVKSRACGHVIIEAKDGRHSMAPCHGMYVMWQNNK